MKIHFVNRNKFFPNVIDFYKTFAEEVPFEEAEVIVKSDFEPIETDKIVATNTTGIEHIKAKEIISLRGEDLSDFTAVPELCMWAMLELVRHRGRQELKGKILGVIGFGRIAMGFAKRLYGFDLRKLVYYDTQKKSSWDGVIFPSNFAVEGFSAKKLSLKKVLEESDIVSLHITADEENRGFMDRAKFELMKNGSWFLNSARPWLVEKEALQWALDTKLAGAWFDFEMPFEHPKLITTNHQGGSTPESLEKSQMLIAQKVKEYSITNKL